MFVWFRRLLRRVKEALRKRVRRKKGHGSPGEIRTPLSDVHREIISRPDIRSPKEGRGFESHPSHHLSPYEIQRRIKDARSKRQRLKPSSKHFPPAPAFEKRHWDKKKKMEDS